MTSEEPLLLHKPELPELRIVLLGRAGDGKSSTGNTILSETKPFPVKPSESSVTERCPKNEGNIGGQKVVVVDTPGLFRLSENQEEVVKEIKESISIVEPHVFLILLNLREKFTSEHQQMVETIRRTFGKNTMAYSMVLFTYGKRLGSTSIEEYIKTNKDLCNLIIQCHWKYHVFDNKDKSPVQVTALLQKINCMIQTSRGSFYTAEMLQEAEEALKEQQQQQQQQQQQVQNPKGEETRATRNPIQTSALIGTGAGCLMGYLGGGGEMTATMGAALGGLSGGILGSVMAGLAIIATNHIKKCTKK